jgi:F0F1-type ATP synthase assembly protein I
MIKSLLDQNDDVNGADEPNSSGSSRLIPIEFPPPSRDTAPTAALDPFAASDAGFDNVVPAIEEQSATADGTPETFYDAATEPVAVTPSAAAVVTDPISYTPPTAEQSARMNGLAFTAGIAFVSSVGFMLVLGWLADILLGTAPWGIVGGIVLGSIIGFVQFFRLNSQILGTAKSSTPSSLFETAEKAARMDASVASPATADEVLPRPDDPNNNPSHL